MADQNVVRNKQRGHKSRPTPRDLLMAVAIGIAGSVVTVSVSYLQLAASAVHVYLVAATLGLWGPYMCLTPSYRESARCECGRMSRHGHRLWCHNTLRSRCHWNTVARGHHC